MVPQWHMDFSKVKVPVGCIVMELFFFFRPGVLPEADWSHFGRATSRVRLKRGVRLAREV